MPIAGVHYEVPKKERRSNRFCREDFSRLLDQLKPEDHRRELKEFAATGFVVVMDGPGGEVIGINVYDYDPQEIEVISIQSFFKEGLSEEYHATIERAFSNGRLDSFES